MTNLPCNARALWPGVLRVVYTAVTLTAVLIAVTTRTWDVIAAACVLCFARGRWSRG